MSRVCFELDGLDVKVGDEAVFIGEQRSVEEYAEATEKVTPYKTLCDLQQIRKFEGVVTYESSQQSS